LIKLGLKGSGDYGVFTVGAYNGQGLNKYDSNRDLHTVMRLAYPFQLDNGQFFEVGLGGYQGKFVVSPTAAKSAPQFTDRRVAANFVWYPQPFGLEAEWTYGEGPEFVNVTNPTTGARTGSPFNRITQEELHGGYVLLNYKMDTDSGTIIPFTRWNYFDGARKFKNSATAHLNAPTQKVNELDFGVEYQPWPSFEVSVVYSHAFERTNTDTAALIKDVDRVTCQLQYNF
jgi:hypothetical protein